jgi:hypothetical protein
VTPSPPIRWRTTTGELDDFAAALKNLDVPYDYVFEVGVAQLERFDEQGLIQLHPASLADRLEPDVRRHLLIDVLAELAVTLVDAPASVRVEDVNLGVSIALTSIRRRSGVHILPRASSRYPDEHISQRLAAYLAGLGDSARSAATPAANANRTYGQTGGYER